MIELKCYDTLTGRYVRINVADEVGKFIKRSYWREDIQDRRFNARRLNYEEALSYNDEDTTVIEVIKREENKNLYKCMNTLDERSRLILYYRYFRRMSLLEIAEYLEISVSYASKLLKKAQVYLKDRLVFDD